MEAGVNNKRLAVRNWGDAVADTGNANCGIMVMGRDGTLAARFLLVDATGSLQVSSGSATKGSNITTFADVAAGVGATVSLNAPTATARKMTVQNTVSGSFLRVREVGGAAGSGIILAYLGSVSYTEGFEQVEIENIGAVATAAALQFEED
jgi:hypothetical protein